MRKKTISNLADTIFWYILYILPVILYALSWINRMQEPLAMQAFFDFVGIDVSNTIVFSTLTELFGSSGIMPLFASNVPFVFLTWFVDMVIVHLIVDFLLFIPRLAHKWMSGVYCNE